MCRQRAAVAFMVGRGGVDNDDDDQRFFFDHVIRAGPSEPRAAHRQTSLVAARCWRACCSTARMRSLWMASKVRRKSLCRLGYGAPLWLCSVLLRGMA